MKYRDLAEIGVKLLGIFSATQFLASLPTAFAMLQNHSFYQSLENQYKDGAVIGLFLKIALAATSACILYFLVSVFCYWLHPELPPGWSGLMAKSPEP